MAMSVMREVEFTNESFLSEGFRNIVEDHLDKLKEKSTELIVDFATANRWTNDLYGLLRQYNVSINLHWITARVNGLYSGSDYDGVAQVILVPDSTAVENLLRLYGSR